MEDQTVEVQERQVPDELNQAIQGHFGEEYSVDTISQALSEREKLRSELESLKSTPRYSTPLIQTLEEMASKGATLPEMMKYMNIQSLDVENMSHEDLIKNQKSLEYPEFTSQEINTWFNREFPPLGEDATELQKQTRDLSIKEMAINARSFLKEKMVESESPAAVQQKQQESAKIAQARTQYTGMAEAIDIPSIPVSLKTEQFGYEFAFNVPRDPEVDQRINAAVVEQALINGKTSKEDIEAMKMKAYKTVYFDDIMESVIRDGWASMNKKALSNLQNDQPVPSGSGAPNAAPPARQKTVVKDKGGTFV